MRIRPAMTTVGVAVALVVSACSSSSNSSSTTPSVSTGQPPAGSIVTNLPASTVVSSTSDSSATEPGSTGPITTLPAPVTVAAATTTLPGAVDPNAPEVVAPGDIPDNQVFIAFAAPSGAYMIRVPEGWARTEADGVVTFTDKYNSIEVRSSAAATAPTVESVTKDGLSDVAADSSFNLLDVQPVTRKAGAGVLATYEIGSAPNSVTGKKALLAVERYVFFHNGTVVTMTLSGAKGADNVDPWKIVTDSLTWK